MWTDYYNLYGYVMYLGIFEPLHIIVYIIVNEKVTMYYMTLYILYTKRDEDTIYINIYMHI